MGKFQCRNSLARIGEKPPRGVGMGGGRLSLGEPCSLSCSDPEPRDNFYLRSDSWQCLFHGSAGKQSCHRIGIGRSVGRNLLRKVTSPRLHRFLQRAEDHEMATVLTVRVFPVAPFSIVNLLVGASRIRFWIFLLGSAIGRIPGIIVLALVGIQFENLLHRPKISSLVLLGLILLLIPLATAWLSKRI